MMKYLTLVLLCVSLPSHSTDVEVRGMEVVEGFERRFDLQTQFDDKLVLDCQSFIQGLFFGQDATGMSVLLDEWECDELVIGVKESLDQSMDHCLNLDLENKILLGHNTCQSDAAK